jgi:hypothetical protein
MRERERDQQGEGVTFLAAALKASLWVMSGLLALMRWISSLYTRHASQIHRT